MSRGTPSRGGGVPAGVRVECVWAWAWRGPRQRPRAVDAAFAVALTGYTTVWGWQFTPPGTRPFDLTAGRAPWRLAVLQYGLASLAVGPPWAVLAQALRLTGGPWAFGNGTRLLAPRDGEAGRHEPRAGGGGGLRGRPGPARRPDP